MGIATRNEEGEISEAVVVFVAEQSVVEQPVDD